MIALITPSQNGHFLNYIELIKLYQGNENIIVFDSKKTFKTFKDIYKKKNEINEIIFLYGEKDFLLSILSKLLFPDKVVKIILYYLIQNPKKNRIQKLKSLIILISTYLNIKLFLLEEDINNSILIKRRNVEKLYDPVLLREYPNELNEDKTIINYLVAGYLDERKSIPLLIDLLIELNTKSHIKRKLTLLGIQSETVKSYIETFSELKTKLDIEIKNYRYKDCELEYYLKQSHIVWAIYKNHYGSSGIVINSIQYNKNVVFLPIGVLKKFSEELKIENIPTNFTKKEISKYLLYLEDNTQYENIFRRHFLKKRQKNNFLNTLLNNERLK